MTSREFPALDAPNATATREVLHAYSRILGDCLKLCRARRKHWWHASLRPSLNGLTTGVVHTGVNVEIELDLGRNLLRSRSALGDNLSVELLGQSPREIAVVLGEFLINAEVDPDCVPQPDKYGRDESAGYSPVAASRIGSALSAVSATLNAVRAGIREETSPIQLWPHHFDMSMLWLPGPKIPGQDPDNEEYADMQMNFGFTFGDDLIAEPYFYVTAYPLPEEFPSQPLPTGTIWQSEGFSGAVLHYAYLLQQPDPCGYLTDLWNGLLSAGRLHMLERSN